ncbi:hypothetical protein [Teredinibacter turnerae]|uniref:hypothetical protein n=1 Tax=Teredinibacter turnerae TaxID=2426 RepID=UPI00036322D4|nr:hypothetical protein [Teredinibacter turnerae]
MSEKITRMSLDQIRKLKGLSNAKKVSSMTDEEIDKIIDEDPDLYHLTDEELSQFDLVKGERNENAK